MWVLIDNYDSFTHILHHYLLQTGRACVVYRNDALSLQDLIDLSPSRLIISPGPETPLQAGISMDALRYFHDKIPVLGVCLGHQAIGMHFGASLQPTPYPMHGKTSHISHSEHALFAGLGASFEVMRYHSLVLNDVESAGLDVIATAADDHTIQAIAHRTFPCIGVQFHPESVGTPAGQTLLRNWAGLYRD